MNPIIRFENDNLLKKVHSRAATSAWTAFSHCLSDWAFERLYSAGCWLDKMPASLTVGAGPFGGATVDGL
jgi:hypothetical protein